MNKEQKEQNLHFSQHSSNEMLSAALSVEGNRLIAEFMKINVTDFVWNEHLGLVHCDEYGDFQIDEDLQYYNPDTDWNDLMPVVEKISRIEYDRYEQENGFEKYIEIETAFPRTFGMINSRTGNPMFRFNRCQCFEAPSLIEVTWLAVVDFIKGQRCVGR